MGDGLGARVVDGGGCVRARALSLLLPADSGARPRHGRAPRGDCYGRVRGDLGLQPRRHRSGDVRGGAGRAAGGARSRFRLGVRPRRLLHVGAARLRRCPHGRRPMVPPARGRRERGADAGERQRQRQLLRHRGRPACGAKRRRRLWRVIAVLLRPTRGLCRCNTGDVSCTWLDAPRLQSLHNSCRVRAPYRAPGPCARGPHDIGIRFFPCPMTWLV
mmetsp:Transcript_84708/g.244883  ORF Transcript_84708/g.244883 Transcript_84708/m.244883 type:complete len:217 (-) Transcript_84708:258-908(-)